MAPAPFVCQVSHRAGTIPLVVLGLAFTEVLGLMVCVIRAWVTASPSHHCRFRWQLPDLARWFRYPCFSHLLSFRCSDERRVTSIREAGDVWCPPVILAWEHHSMNLLWFRWQTAAFWPYQDIHLILKKTNLIGRALPAAGRHRACCNLLIQPGGGCQEAIPYKSISEARGKGKEKEGEGKFSLSVCHQKRASPRKTFQGQHWAIWIPSLPEITISRICQTVWIWP